MSVSGWLFACLYDRMTAATEAAGLRAHRQRLLRGATGRSSKSTHDSASIDAPKHLDEPLGCDPPEVSTHVASQCSFRIQNNRTLGSTPVHNPVPERTSAF